MEHKLIISQSQNITCIAGLTYTGKTKKLIESLKNHISDGQTIKPFIFVSPELNEELVKNFYNENGIKQQGIFVNSANTEQSMLQIFDDCITTMRNVGIQVMAFDNLPKHNAMDIIELYNKLKDIKDLYFIFSHHIALDVAEKLQSLDEKRTVSVADIRWNVV